MLPGSSVRNVNLIAGGQKSARFELHLSPNEFRIGRVGVNLLASPSRYSLVERTTEAGVYHEEDVLAWNTVNHLPQYRVGVVTITLVVILQRISGDKVSFLKLIVKVPMSGEKDEQLVIIRK